MEVSCLLENRSVFVTGETLKCEIAFRKKKKSSLMNEDDDPSYTKRRSNNLAWASAQIHCTCSISEEARASAAAAALAASSGSVNGLPNSGASSIGRKSSVISPTAPPLHSSTWTSSSFLQPMKGEVGGTFEVFTTKPQILFCDLNLDEKMRKNEAECDDDNDDGDYFIFHYSEKIPFDLPPSYYGYNVKYSYRIIIGTQKVNSSIRLLKIPFRVLPSINSNKGLKSICVPPQPIITSSVNPFLMTPEDEKYRDNGNHLMNELSDLQIHNKKSVRYYEIASSKGKLAKLCLFKNGFKLGEDLTGNFEFYNDTIKCVEYSVSLHSEEIVKDSNSSEINIGKMKTSSRKLTTTHCHTKYHDVTVGMHYSNMEMQIPLHITPSFSTDICVLNYLLHFVFVITPKFDCQSIDDDHNEWNGPKTLDIETMAWDLPITIYPTTPTLVSHVLQPTTKHSACINL